MKYAQDAPNFERAIPFARTELRTRSSTVRMGHIEAYRLMMNAFEVLGRPAFIIDTSFASVACNNLGETLLDQYFDKNHLALRPIFSEELDEFATAIRSNSSTAPRAAPLIVSDRDGSKVLLWSVPLTQDMDKYSDVNKKTEHILIIGQRGCVQVAMNELMVQKLLGLSLSESRLCILIGKGQTVADAAAALGIKNATARVVLKHIFSKLEIHRQSQLVALLSRLDP